MFTAPAGSSPPQTIDAQWNSTPSYTLETHLNLMHHSALCVAVGADKQCELTCRPAGYRFYVRLSERVRDGTPCVNTSTNDVCVEGRCLVSGSRRPRATESPKLDGDDKVQNLAVLVFCLQADLSLAFRLRASPKTFAPFSRPHFSVSSLICTLWFWVWQETETATVAQFAQTAVK